MTREKNTTDKASDGQRDVAGRNAASTGISASGTSGEARGQSAEGDAPVGTQLAAALQSGLDSTTIDAKSTTLDKPDAELKAALLTDVRTEERRMAQEAARAEGGDEVDGKATSRLEAIAKRVRAAQKELDEAMRKRDAARDEYDEEVDRQSAAGNRPHGETVADYFKAADAQRAEEAELRRRALSR